MSITRVTPSMEELLLEIEDLKKANLKLREDLSEIKTTKEELQDTVNRLSSIYLQGKGEFATIFQDITERKHAEELLLRQNSMLDSINLILDAALTSTSEKELGDVCLDIARRITGSEFGFIGFVNDRFIEEIAKSDPFRESSIRKILMVMECHPDDSRHMVFAVG